MVRTCCSLITLLAVLAFSACASDAPDQADAAELDNPSQTTAQEASIQRASYTEERFDQLQSSGSLILVDVWAAWCGTCAQQSEVLDAYAQEHPDSQINILRVDFDAQKDAVTRFNAPRQSTLVLYDGEEQVWFSVAETSREAIFEALREAEGRRG